MTASRRRHRSSAVGPLDDDDLLREILLRLPPQPSSLPRASLVCRRWCLLVSDPRFGRRFRVHHRRNPPLLGYFGSYFSLVPTLEAPNRVPPGCFSFQRDCGGYLDLRGCRHGLALVFHASCNMIVVWDPVTGDQHPVGTPQGFELRAAKRVVDGAVLRAAGDGQHFQVVLAVAVDDGKQHRQALACVYSSETGAWGDLISTLLPSEVSMEDYSTMICTANPAVLVGDSLYWMLSWNFCGILKFDLEKQNLAVIRVPTHMLEDGHYRFWIMRAEGGDLGLFFQLDCSIQLWKRKIDCDGVASWELGRTIELDKLIPLNSEGLSIPGFAEENNVLFLWTKKLGVEAEPNMALVFMVHLESLQFKKLFETTSWCHYYPFESVYTAEISIDGGHDGADLLHNT